MWEGDGREDSWHSRTELLEMGYKKLLDEKDQQLRQSLCWVNVN